jgi:hypothetical protein
MEIVAIALILQLFVLLWHRWSPHKYEREKQDLFLAEYEALKSTVAIDEPILFIYATHSTQAQK